MKAKLTASIMVAVMFLVAPATLAQQSETATDLRKQIQELVVFDRSDATPPEVRALNRTFIRERRVRLRALLEQRIVAMNKYLASVNGIIAAEERSQVQAAIRDFENEVTDLDKEISNNGASSATAEAATSPAGQQPISTRVAATEDSATALPASSDAAPGSARVPTAAPAFRATASSAPLAAQAGGQPASPQKEVDQFKAQLEIEKANIVDGVVQDVTGRQDAARTRGAGTFGPTQDPTAFAKILSMNLFPQQEFTSEIEAARVDKQVGGPASNAGSTSLVNKGSVPAILGFAVENGGLTRTNQGTTMTFRGNFVGLVDALAGRGFIDSFDDDSLSTKRLRKLSFAVSYDTSIGDSPNVFLGNRQQLSSYSFRYEFFNHRDPRDPRYTAKWAQLVKVNAQPVARDSNRVQNLFLRDASLRAWLEDARDAIARAPDGTVASVVRTKLEELETMTLSPAVQTAVNQFSDSFSKYRSERDELLKTVANGPIFTVDYVNNRRPGLIDTSNLKFIYSTGMFEGRASWTVNGSGTIFNANPGPGVNRLRDFDFSTQFDLPLGDPRGFGQFDLSFAGQYKRLAEDEIVNGVTLATKGDIGTFNLKLEVPIKRLGIKFPVALTYSNRTEFDLKQQLRANFGFAFDPDTLYNLLKPFGK